MNNLIVQLRLFSKNIIEERKLPLPVKIELLDKGSNRCFQIEALSKDEEGVYDFSDPRFDSPGAICPGPFTVRFTADGRPALIIDFPFSIARSAVEPNPTK